MILLVLIAVLVCLSTWVYIRWRRVKSYWAERGVPYLPPHPVYGSLTFLQKINTVATDHAKAKNGHCRPWINVTNLDVACTEETVSAAIWMCQMYDRFQSLYIGIWLFWRPALIVNCPELGRNILVKDSANFRNRLVSSAAHDSIGHLNIFTAKDPLWSNVRRRLTPAFTSSKLRAVQLLMNTKSKELVQRIAMESKKGKFSIRDVYNDCTSDITGTASLGVKSDATLTGSSAIREITKDFERYSWLRGIAWSCIFFFPELVAPLRFTFFPKNATDYFRKIYEIMVNERKTTSSDDRESRDLLDVLIKMKKDIVLEGDQISDDVLVSQAAILIQGGFDTSGAQLTFSTYELAHHPEIQKRLYNEVKQAEEKNGGSDFDESTLANLTYLNCVIKESTRKYPPMGWLDRVSSSDYQIDDKLTISAGTPVYVNAIGMHYDPNYFPDPTKFDPDRFLPENETNIKKFTFLPFGDGPRNCIGQRFAYATIRTALTAIILTYELRPVPNTPKPTEVQIEKNGMFLSPGEPLYVEYVPRK